MLTFDGLNPPYSTIVADPPWPVRQASAGWTKQNRSTVNADLPYSTLSLVEIADLPVANLAADYAHLYLWTVNRFVRQAYSVVEAWGFSRPTLLTWCKPPQGIGPGREFASTTEFVLFARRGSNSERGHRVDSNWWLWPRGAHSAKPPAFLDLVESVSPGPYVELFARAPRLGWDSWGLGYESNRNAPLSADSRVS